MVWRFSSLFFSISVIFLVQADGGCRNEEWGVYQNGCRCVIDDFIGLVELVFEELLVLLVKRFQLSRGRSLLRTFETLMHHGFRWRAQSARNCLAVFGMIFGYRCDRDIKCADPTDWLLQTFCGLRLNLLSLRNNLWRFWSHNFRALIQMVMLLLELEQTIVHETRQCLIIRMSMSLMLLIRGLNSTVEFPTRFRCINILL